MSSVFIQAVGLAAPGLPGWQDAQDVLRGERDYAPAELPAYQPALLPPNERRRASASVRMAFRVAEEALRGSGRTAGELATVFVSADGDLQISNRLCLALATPERFISPTDFHNSVHNAAAGYWSIAGHAQGPSTSLCGGDEGFAIGLLEAMAMVQVDGWDTLLAVYDLAAPDILRSKRAIVSPCGVALVLSARPGPATLARLSVTLESGTQTTTLQNGALEALRVGNPAARVLPLLRILSSRDWRPVHLACSGNTTVRLDVSAP